MSRVWIIAEVGSVHDGSFGNAKKLIELAAECGADAVKFQTHLAEAETLRDAPMPPYFRGEPRYEYFRRTGFSAEQWAMLVEHARSHRIEFLSSPFSIEAVDLLEQVGMARYKIPSGEVTNLPLLERVSETGKPVLLSSGMSSWREMDAAVATVKRFHDRLSVMQCTTSYPCPVERVGLNILDEMRERWDLPVGYSDHTLDNFACFAAVSRGATTIEKHLTFSRKMYGSDAPHSAEPTQFAELIRGIRDISSMLMNPVDKDDLVPYGEMKEIFQKSIVAAQDIPEGVILQREMLAFKKPGTGIPPGRVDELLGRRVCCFISADTLIRDEQIESPTIRSV
jgi:N,N'-diacetyllegionaminate synthase